MLEVERLVSTIEKSWAYQIVRRLLDDDHVLKFFKAMLVADIAERRLFEAVARDLGRQHDGLIVVPDTSDPFLKARQPNLADTHTGIWEACQQINRLQYSLQRAWALFILFLVPIGFVLKHLRWRSANASETYDSSVPVFYGPGESSLSLSGVRTPRDDWFAYLRGLPPGKVVHVFGDVRQRPEIEGEFKKRLEAHGLPFVDRRNFGLTAQVLRIALSLPWGLLRGWFSREGFGATPLCTLRYAARALYWFLVYKLDADHVRASVDVIRDDYAPRHILKTVVAAKHGRKTVGLQHAAGIYDIPQLAYVHVDHYAVCSANYVTTFLPYWNGLKLERIGRESVDWIVDLMQDAKRLETVRERLGRKYKRRRYTVLFALALAIDPPPKHRWDEVYEALLDFIRSPLDANVFLRFRRAGDFKDASHLRRLADLSRLDDRVILEHQDFTTYELMAISDLFIANSASFSIFEAIATKAAVFTFDFLGTAKYFFPSYGKDFILQTKEDLAKVFSGLETGFQGFDCRWDQIRADGDYHYDGRNSERFQALMAQAVAEARPQAG